MSEGTYLKNELIHYSKSGSYPFHMPGHKRQMKFPNPYELDITEIAGFDNLHQANGILEEEQLRAARLYGADRSFYLVNGSTCGLLAVISAAVPKGGHVLAARNCHKSVYHALQLREAEVTWVCPVMTKRGICGQVPAEAIEKALQTDPDRTLPPQTDRDRAYSPQSGFCAVILTSPTYDGVVSDIAQIARLAHRYGIPLIVDAAHGAHFGFVPGFPENPLKLGADACVVSVHKTLPAFTQTALLHLKGNRISAERAEEYLDIYETSSPSYLLMAGISDSVRFMETQGLQRLSELSARLKLFYEHMRTLTRLHVLRKEELSEAEAFDFDESKILIFTAGTGLSGIRLQELLRTEYGLELEMACGEYALALTSMMDTEEGFRRLEEALRALDVRLQEADPAACGQEADSQDARAETDEPVRAEADAHVRAGTAYAGRVPRQVMTLAEAAELSAREIPFADACGAVSHSLVVPYPPGIPVVAPGEQIDEAVIGTLRHCRAQGIDVEGITGNDGIKIVKF